MSWIDLPPWWRPAYGPLIGLGIFNITIWYHNIRMLLDQKYLDRQVADLWIQPPPGIKEGQFWFMDYVMLPVNLAIYFNAYVQFRLRQRLGLPRDPLVLDLNGDGIKTTSVVGENLTFFDHNRDGFAELTGWVAGGDGLLVMDRNANGIIDDGSELFGDQTTLRNGTRATNGFEALAELDSNGDGKVDANDAGFSQLRVLRLNEAGDAYQLYTLDELGIKGFNLDSTITNITDAYGNTQSRVGSFEMLDGTVRQIAEYNFRRDPMLTIPREWIEVPDDIAALPDLPGYGGVYDLHQAMVRDTTGELKSLVQQFANSSDENSRTTLMYNILLKWTGSEQITDSRLRFANYDNHKIQMLEKFFGEPFTIEGESETGNTFPSFNQVVGGASSGGGPILLPPAPRLADASVVNLNESYRLVFEFNYSVLMARTHLKDLYDKITVSWDDQMADFKIHMNGVTADLQASLANNPEEGRKLLSEFARSFRGFGAQDAPGYLSFRETFINLDPSLAWAIDTAGLPVYEHLHQGLRTWSPHIEGTDNADAVKGSLTEGDGFLNGLNGDDVIYGTSRDETLINGWGDAMLVAGGGDDRIWAGEGNDILDGGEGNDQLLGEAGNDTYLFRRGSGQDTIIDADATPDNVDTIWLGSNLTPEDIILRGTGNNLVLKIVDTSDTLTVQDFFRNDSTLNRVERIQFVDGTVWTVEDMIIRAYSPTEGDDLIYGSLGDDTLSGLGGNDTIYGRTGADAIHGDAGNDKLYGADGDDVLDGGAGDDVLEGWTGNDTYVFNRGYGQDTIIDPDKTPGNIDTLELAAGILPGDVRLARIGNDLKLTIADTLEAITIKNWLEGDTQRNGIEAIKFADGTIWGVDAMQSILLTPPEGNEIVYGFSGADTIEGGDGDDLLDGGPDADILYGEAGNDTLIGGDGYDRLYGGDGDDILAGGAGNDILNGGSEGTYSGYLDNANGNDTYLFGRGSGQDTITDRDKTPGNIDTIRFADDLTPGDITVRRNGENLELSISGTIDKLIVQNWFWNDSGEYRVERIEFADGTISDTDRIKRMPLLGTSGERLRLESLFSDFRVGAGYGVSALPTLLCTTFFCLTRDDLSVTNNVGEKPHGFLGKPTIDHALRQSTLCLV